MNNRLLFLAFALNINFMIAMEPELAITPSILSIPHEVIAQAINYVSPLQWLDLMCVCKQWHILFQPNGAVDGMMHNSYEQSALNLMWAETRKLNYTYQYALFIQDQTTLDETHMNGNDKWINPTVNLLPCFKVGYSHIYMNDSRIRTELTPMFWACLHEHIGELGFLITRIKKESINNATIRAQFKPIFSSYCNWVNLPQRSEQLCTILKEVGFNFNQEIPGLGFPLMQAIYYRNIDLINFLVTEDQVEINPLLPKESPKHYEPHFRCSKGQEPEFIGSKLNDIPLCVIKHYTPIAYAVSRATDKTIHEDIQIVELLIKNGANPFSKGAISRYYMGSAFDYFDKFICASNAFTELNANTACNASNIQLLQRILHNYKQPSCCIQ